jgi:hypothetical protein
MDDFCTFTLADYDSTTNTTSCEFTVYVPAVPSAHLNYIGLSATAPDLSGDPTIAITASDFDVFTTDDLSDIETGTALTFTIAPNSLFDGRRYLQPYKRDISPCHMAGKL